MPIYEYACAACGHEFEALVRSDTVPECPQCHATTLNKLLSVPAKPSDSTGPMALPASPCGGCAAPGSHGGCPFSGAG
ncbi:FmdB family zinc ribbon protein [Hydrogenophaga soli]